MELDPAARAAGYRHVALADIGSTNAEALSRARDGEHGPLWVTADTQSAGRGRRGHQWVSPPGNLYATLLLVDPAPVELAPQLAFVASLAVYDAMVDCAPVLEPAIALKWPNDVLIGGAKAAGLLLESENTPTFAVAIGIGVNCSRHPDEASYPATDLKSAGAMVAPERLFQVLSTAMPRRLELWQRGRDFPAIRRDWLRHAAGLGEQIHVRLAERELRGRFVGLDSHGRLLVQPDEGPHEKIAAGEIFAFGAARR